VVRFLRINFGPAGLPDIIDPIDRPEHITGESTIPNKGAKTILLRSQSWPAERNRTKAEGLGQDDFIPLEKMVYRYDLRDGYPILQACSLLM